MKKQMALQIRAVFDYDIIWWDKGSGGSHDGSFWRAKAPEGYHLLGDTGNPGYGEPQSATIVVKADSDPDALKPPTDYTQIWNDRKSGADWDGSFWTPVPPPGYKACGTVTMRNHEKPPLNLVMCVKESYVEQGKLGNFVWNDSKTGAADDFGAWQIVANSEDGLAVGSFYGAPSHQANQGVFDATTGHVLKHSATSAPAGLSLPDLHAVIAKYGPVLHVHPDEVYLPTSVEYFASNGELLEKATGKKTSFKLNDLPTGPDSGEKYQLLLKDEGSRHGIFDQAVAYVHAKKAGDFSTDLQFWFFSAYNGPGWGRVKWLIFDSTAHAGNPSLAPLGEHEGDWEHVTLRINNASHKPEKLYYSQHAGGTWIDYDDVPKAGNGFQPVVYSSKNGHASYWTTGNNYSEHHKYSVGLTALEFFLINQCADGGKVLDCSKKYEIINAACLGADAPPQPNWVGFRGRWGASTDAHVDVDFVRKVLVAAFGPIIGNIAAFTGLGALASVLLPLFKLEDQDGPTAPIAKGSWDGDE